MSYPRSESTMHHREAPIPRLADLMLDDRDMDNDGDDGPEHDASSPAQYDD